MVLGTPGPRPRPQPRPAPPSSSRPPLGSPLLSLRPWPASIVDPLASLSSTIRVAAHRRLGRCRAARRPIGRGASGRGRGGCSMQACSSLHVTTLRLRRWAVRWQASEAKPSESERGADLSGAAAAGRLGEGRELGIWEARQLVPLGPPHWAYWASLLEKCLKAPVACALWYRFFEPVPRKWYQWLEPLVSGKITGT